MEIFLTQSQDQARTPEEPNQVTSDRARLYDEIAKVIEDTLSGDSRAFLSEVRQHISE